VSEPRLYLYRKAGREVWDAEMWLPDGRRRGWRTGITDKVAAMAAARERLEALAAVQTVAPIEGVCTADACAPVMSPSAIARDAGVLAERAEAPLYTGGNAQASAGKHRLAQTTSSEAPVAMASEDRAQAIQMPEKAREPRALARFDRWFFSDFRTLWGSR
jgi:hypothetical protein